MWNHDINAVYKDYLQVSLLNIKNMTELLLCYLYPLVYFQDYN